MKKGAIKKRGGREEIWIKEPYSLFGYSLFPDPNLEGKRRR